MFLYCWFWLQYLMPVHGICVEISCSDIKICLNLFLYFLKIIVVTNLILVNSVFTPSLYLIIIAFVTLKVTLNYQIDLTIHIILLNMILPLYTARNISRSVPKFFLTSFWYYLMRLLYIVCQSGNRFSIIRVKCKGQKLTI